jgi:hypothetical protein
LGPLDGSGAEANAVRARPVIPLSVILILAGCIQGIGPVAPDAGGVTRDLIGEPIVQKHDHEDASQHTGRANVRFVAWNPLIEKEFPNEGLAGFWLWKNHAFVATDGAHAGFVVVNLTDVTNPTVVSQYSTPGGASQETRVTPDGKWLFLNLQRAPGAVDLVSDPSRGTGYGIQVVNVEDKSKPRFESFLPVEVYGSHTMYYKEIGGQGWLFFTEQASRHGLPDGSSYTSPAGNAIGIAKFTDAGGKKVLQRVAEYRYLGGLAARTSQGCFPHDMWVDTHPLTKREIMYVGHWDCGAIAVDVTDPANPRQLSVYADPKPSKMNRLHFVRQDPEMRDGRVIAWSGPEIDQSPGEPGYMRAYDVTDPAKMTQIGWWRLPGEVENDMPFIFTPHNFDFKGNLMALAHYHAGLWVLNVSDPENPRALGYYMPHGKEGDPYKGKVWRKTPNFPIAYLPNVYDARFYDDPVTGKTYILATERGTGLYVLEYTGER